MKAAASSKQRTKSSPTIFRLPLGVGHAGEPLEEAVGRLDGDQVDLEVARKGLLHLLDLALPKQPVVDKNAGQLVAYRAVGQSRGNSGIDAAGEPANHPCISHLVTNSFHRRLDDRMRGPGRR